MRIFIVVLMFFIIGALIIIGNNHLMMSSSGNFGIFFDLYVKWLDNVYINFQSVTGNVVKMEWLPE